MEMLQAAMDTDQDGKVSLAEGFKFVRQVRLPIMLREAAPILNNMDTNGDGLLSPHEFDEDLKAFAMEDSRREDLRNRFAFFDDDGDEVLSAEEALPLFTYMFRFQKLDLDKDGLLTLEEFRAIAAPKLKGRPESDVAQSHEESKSIFAELDTDGDRRLDAREHYDYESGDAAGRLAFRELISLGDADQDGQVDAAELADVPTNPKFGGSAAFHHSLDWIKKVEEALQRLEAEAETAKAKGKGKAKRRRRPRGGSTPRTPKAEL